MLAKLETKLDEWLNKKAPFQMPASAKDSLVRYMPWLTLLAGVVLLWMAYWSWNATLALNRVADYLNQWSVAYGTGAAVSPLNSLMVWVSVILMVVEGVIFFMAYPGLKAKQKKGWNLLFWAALLNVLVGVAQILAVNGYALISLLSAVVGLYVLFQIRGSYTGAMASSTPAAPKDTTPPTETPTETK